MEPRGGLWGSAAQVRRGREGRPPALGSSPALSAPAWPPAARPGLSLPVCTVAPPGQDLKALWPGLPAAEQVPSERRPGQPWTHLPPPVPSLLAALRPLGQAAAAFLGPDVSRRPGLLLGKGSSGGGGAADSPHPPPGPAGAWPGPCGRSLGLQSPRPAGQRRKLRHPGVRPKLHRPGGGGGEGRPGGSSRAP